jgi:D-serine deaminase-like pyridoxal phosphate-dependent protein
MKQTNNTLIGCERDALETPALLVDLPALEANEHAMAAIVRETGVQLRPHAKAHRSPDLARRQVAAGAIGVCCGNLPDAFAMAAEGIDDILLTRQVVHPAQLAAVARLAATVRITVIVDDETVLDRIDQAAQAAGVRLPLLIDVDLRLGRSGVPPHAPALRLAHAAARRRGVELRGLLGYEGSMHQFTPAERDQACRMALAALVETRALIERDGLPLAVVSVGATSTSRVAAAIPGITEIQPGAYLLGDARYRRTQALFGCAVTVLTSVISRPNARRVTIDAGEKKLSTDAGLPEVCLPGLRVTALNEEHGLLERDPDGPDLRVGDRLEVLPSHAGTTINLYDRIYALRDGRIAAIWRVLGHS